MATYKIQENIKCVSLLSKYSTTEIGAAVNPEYFTTDL